MRHLVVKDEQQTIVSYPMLALGSQYDLIDQPTAVNVRVGTPAVSMPDAWSAATVDTLSSTTSTSYSSGSTIMSGLTSASFVKNRRYLVTPGSTGEQGTFIVSCARSFTGTTMYLSQPLPMSIAGSSTVKGIAVLMTITTTQSATEGSGVVLWQVTIGGVDYSYKEQLDIVRRIPRWELDAEMLTKRLPMIETIRERSDVAFDETINAALQMELLPRLRSRGIREENIVSTTSLIPAHVAAVAYHLAKNDPSRPSDYRAELRQELAGAIDLALQDVTGWYDSPQTDDGSAGESPGTFSSIGYSR